MLLCAGAVAAACGGGGTSGTARPSTPLPPTPVVNGNHVIVAPKGYAADVPAGWSTHPVPGPVEAPTQFPPDVYLAPTTRSLADPATILQPSITVACLTPIAGATDQASARSQWATVAAGAASAFPPVTPVAEANLTVAGVPAARFDYRLTLSGGHTLDRADVIFVAGKCRWLIRLDTLLGTGKTDQGFAAFLASFKLIS
ncbi:MAG TPA: hypothetical protein VEZ14_04195 [Dehalococcoidia bacterium]|nr:hypothetical protein [Dehalococcoidia bacterium]